MAALVKKKKKKGEKVRVEMKTGPSSGLEAYKAAMLLPVKWLEVRSSGKRAADLLELFIKNYLGAGKKIGPNVPPRLSIATEDDMVLSDEASLQEILSTSKSLRVVASPTEKEPEIETVWNFCDRLEKAPFRLMTGLLYRVVAQRKGALERVPESERKFYREFREIVVATPLQNLVQGVDEVLRVSKTPVTRAIAAEMVKAKVFLFELTEAKRKRLVKFEGFDYLPTFEELFVDIFGLQNHAPRSRWRSIRQEDDDDVSRIFAQMFSPLTYFVRSFYSPSGFVWTSEAILSLGNYLKSRLAVKPVNFRPMVVEINARDGRFSHFLRRASGLEIVATDFREDKCTRTVDFIFKDGTIRDIANQWRPAIIINAFSYIENPEWLKDCKNSVKDDDFDYIDMPEYILIGPSTNLMPHVPLKKKDPQVNVDLKESAMFGGFSQNIPDLDAMRDARLKMAKDAKDGALIEASETQKTKDFDAFEGYEAVHVDEVSRHFFHVDDVGRRDKYGHICCVSFRAEGSLLTQFRTEDEVAKSKAENVVASAIADAQRGNYHFNDDRYARAISEAQETLQNLQLKKMEQEGMLPPSAL